MIILAGQPGAGKGTQAALLAERDGLEWVSAGEIARQAAQHDLHIQQQLAQGELLDSTFMTGLLEAALHSDHSNTLLEGAPRELPQADWLLSWLEAHVASESIVIEIVISDETTIARSQSRHRSDDTLKTIESRIAQYHKQTKPALQRLAEILPFYTVDGEKPVDEVYEQLKHIILYHPKAAHEDSN